MENMKTIAVIESCDTKFKEAKFISDFIKNEGLNALVINTATCLLYTSPSPRDGLLSRMPSSA